MRTRASVRREREGDVMKWQGEEGVPTVSIFHENVYWLR